MKINIGENIKRLRRNRELTQEQLAEVLNVSITAVSKWERCETYPDITLLPVLAEFFETSVDKLLGLDEVEKDKQAHQAISDFLNACDESEPIEKLVEMLKGIRRDHIASKHIQLLYYHWWEQYDKPEVIAELRKIADIRLEKYPDRLIDQDIIERMTKYDDEEHALELIKSRSTVFDMTEDSLLHERYNFRQEFDKLEPYRQRRIHKHITRLFSHIQWNDLSKPKDVNYSYDLNNMLFGFLNNFCGHTPAYEHQASGNGEVDLFVKYRVLFGLRRAAQVAMLGDIEQAFVIIEDAVSLLEKLMHLPDGYKIEGTSQFIPDICATVEHVDEPHVGEFFGGPTAVLQIDDGVGVRPLRVVPRQFLRQFVMPRHWAWFDPIRNDPRFLEYTDRIKALSGDK